MGGHHFLSWRMGEWWFSFQKFIINDILNATGGITMKYIQLVFGYLFVSSITLLIIRLLFSYHSLVLDVLVVIMTVLFVKIKGITDSNYPFDFSLESRFRILL